MMNPGDRRQNCAQIFGGAERLSLSPAEGERAGVRGNPRTAIDKLLVEHHPRPPHLDPLPFRLAAAKRFGEAGRGEGSECRAVRYPTASPS